MIDTERHLHPQSKNMRKIFTLLTALGVTATLSAQVDTTTAKDLDGVVVTGQYKPQSVKNSVYQVRTITKERIQQQGAAKLQDVLNNELNIRFSDGSEVNGTFLLSTFANSNQYGNNAFIAPNASLIDKRLNLVLLKPVSALTALEKIYKLFSGNFHLDKDAKHYLFDTIEIKRNMTGPAHIDGDPVMLEETIVVSCVPHSLRILTPVI